MKPFQNRVLSAVIVAGLAFGGQAAFASDQVSPSDHVSPSPDKQWVYHCSADGSTVGILQAGTTEAVLDLSLDGGETAAAKSGVVWAPDSKRFAFDHWDGYKSSGATFYQLQDCKWTALSQPEDEIHPIFDRALSAAKIKKHVSKNARERDVGEYLKVTQWTSADTAVLRAIETFEVGDDFLALGFLFSVKFDAEGNWKIVETHQMSEAEPKE
jgi:hypothetical protein